MTKRTLATLIAFLLSLAAAYWFFIARPRAALVAANTARVGAVQATAAAGASQDTIKIVVDHQAEVARITQRTVETTREILTAPGADAPIDPALHAAGLRALCLHDGRDDLLCAEVLHGARDGERPEG